MRRRHVRGFASIALVLAAAARTFAADQVDLEVRPKERVLGTLYPKEERETFLVDVPKFARITARAWRTGRRDSAPKLTLMDGAESVQPGKPDSKGAALKSYMVGKSGSFGLRVESDGAFDGDYQFKVTVAPQKTWSTKSGADVAAGAESTFDFAAPAGATIDVTLTPAHGSSFVPRITEIDGPDGFVFPVDGADATPRRHRVRGVVFDAGGDHVVRLRNEGGAAGAFAIVVHVAPARLAKSDPIDIRDVSLTSSRFDDDSRVFGRVIDARGGVLTDPGDTTSPLAGASVVVPTDAVPSPVIFAFESSDDIPDPSGASSGSAAQPGGPSVKLLPEHTTFDKSLTVTIPYDPENYDDPTHDVLVNTEDPVTHESVAAPGPFAVDPLAHTVSYPASHFSRFQAASTKPRPVKGQFVELDMGGRVTAAGGTATLSLSIIDGLKGRISGNAFNRALPRRSIVWSQTAADWDEVQPPQQNGVITVVDDEDVTLTDTVDGAVRYTRGRNPDVLIHRPAAGAAGAAVSVLLRRAKGAPTVSNLAGDWKAFVLETSALHFTGAESYKGLNLEMASQVLQLRFGLDAGVTARASVKFGAVADDAADHDGIGRWFFGIVGGRGLPKPGSLAFPDDGSNTVLFTMPLGARFLQAATVRLYPVLRGEMLVGVADNSDLSPSVGPLERLVVMVRSRDATSKQHLLDGDSTFAAFGLDAVDFAGPPASQDFAFVADDLVAAHDGVAGVVYSGRRDTFGRDALGAPSTASNPAFTVPSPYVVATDGSYFAKAALLSGAVTVRPNVFVATRFVKGSLSVGFGVLRRPTQ